MYGVVESWVYGVVEAWRMEVWRMEVRMYGGVARGGVDARRRGHAEVWASRTQLPFAA